MPALIEPAPVELEDVPQAPVDPDVGTEFFDRSALVNPEADVGNTEVE